MINVIKFRDTSTLERLSKYDLIGKIVYEGGLSFYFFKNVDYFCCFGTPSDIESARFDRRRGKTKKRIKEIDDYLEKKLNGEWDGYTHIGRFESFHRKYPDWYRSENMYKIERLEVV